MDSSDNDNNVTANGVVIPTAGIMRLPEVLQAVGVKETTWREGMKLGFYPQSFPIGKRAVGWAAEDIRQLLQDLREGKVFKQRA
jgi:predicted DNA-binding transcriptional regulator AlpA